MVPEIKNSREDDAMEIDQEYIATESYEGVPQQIPMPSFN